jgi:hypothetical protein
VYTCVNLCCAAYGRTRILELLPQHCVGKTNCQEGLSKVVTRHIREDVARKWYESADKGSEYSSEGKSETGGERTRAWQPSLSLLSLLLLPSPLRFLSSFSLFSPDVPYHSFTRLLCVVLASFTTPPSTNAADSTLPSSCGNLTRCPCLEEFSARNTSRPRQLTMAGPMVLASLLPT